MIDFLRFKRSVRIHFGAGIFDISFIICTHIFSAKYRRNYTNFSRARLFYRVIRFAPVINEANFLQRSDVRAVAYEYKAAALSDEEKRDQFGAPLTIFLFLFSA